MVIILAKFCLGGSGVQNHLQTLLHWTLCRGQGTLEAEEVTLAAEDFFYDFFEDPRVILRQFQNASQLEVQIGC